MKRSLSRLSALTILASLALLGGIRPADAGTSATMEIQPAYAGATILSLHGSGVSGAAAVVGEMGRLTVYVSVSGLKPSSTHTEQIHAGLCGGNGPVKYPLKPLVADGAGRAYSVSEVKVSKIQTMGWSISVHATAAGMAPIACGNVWGPDLSFPLRPAGKAQVRGDL